MGFFEELGALDPAAQWQARVAEGEDPKEAWKTSFDPAGIFSGLEQPDLSAARQRQLQAQLDAIAAQEEMTRRQQEMGAPYRQVGYEALPQLRESLGPESKLGRFRSTAAQGFGSRLERFGFNPRAAASLGQRAVSGARAGEERARQGRIRDVVSLGAGQTAQGMGMAGQQGRGLAQTYLQGAQLMGQQMAERAAARQAQQAGIPYAGSRLANELIAEQGRRSYFGGY